MTEVDRFANLSGIWLGMRKVVSFLPKETNHLDQEVVRETVEFSGLGVNMIDIVNLTDFFKLSLQTQFDALIECTNFDIFLYTTNIATQFSWSADLYFRLFFNIFVLGGFDKFNFEERFDELIELRACPVQNTDELLHKLIRIVLGSKRKISFVSLKKKTNKHLWS